MIYYIDSIQTDIDNVIANFASEKKPVSANANEFTISGTSGSHIIGVALPKPHSLISVDSTGSAVPQKITDKFFNAAPRDIEYDGVVYTIYYYKINVGLRDSDTYLVRIS